MPSSLEEIGPLATAIDGLNAAFDISSQEAALDDLLVELGNFDFEELVVRDAGVALGRIIASDDRLEVELDGISLTAFGNFSELLDVDVDLADPEQSVGLNVSSVVVNNRDGDEIASIRDIADLDDLSDGVRQLLPGDGVFISRGPSDDLINGTGGDDDLIGGGGDDIINGFGGSDFIDGGPGDDLINPGDNVGGAFGGDFVVPGLGNDTIDLSDTLEGYVGIGYNFLDFLGGQSITVDIDGGTNFGEITYSGGDVDKIINVNNTLFSGFVNGGISIRGTASDDTFNLTPEGDQWMSVQPGAGTDSYSTNGTGLVRLDFRDAVQGIEVNLSTGQIVDDGFGNSENIGGTSSVWDIQGSGFDDVLTGSSNDGSYTAFGGNNTLDGGGGFDRLRYDRFTIASVNIDAENGMVNGALSNGGTFTDTISGFEYFRSSNGNDQIIGEASADNLYEGRDGIDTFVHRGGNDTIVDFDPSTETLIVSLAGLDQAQVDAALSSATVVPGGPVAGASFVTLDPGVRVDFGGGNSVNLSGVTLTDLTGANVQFVEPGAANLVLGTNGNDTLEGTPGDDLIITGDNPGFDIVIGSAGDDEIDFSGITGDPGGFVELNYSGIGTTIDAQIDGGANTGSVVKDGLGTDTLQDVEKPLQAGWTTGGLGITGTPGADRFDVSPSGQQWMTIRPGDGVDTIIIGGDSTERANAEQIGFVRLDMTDGFGVDVNLATGVIANDGFDNMEQIQGSAPLWEVRGSAGNDTFIGSDNSESYRYTGGNNVLDGGVGFDRVRYDSFGVFSVVIDADNGVVNGAFDSGGTFTDTISGFEWLRGSDGDDRIIGEEGVDNEYQGRGGIDTFVHLGGNDTISDFDVANETLIVRVAGLDQSAVDAAIAGASDQGGSSLVQFGGGSVLVSGVTPADLAGADVLFSPTAPIAPPPPATPPAWVVGDPHLLTLDGVGYDFHAIGEFVLLRGTAGGNFSDFEIQSRMGPVLDDAGDPLPNVSANIAIAARLGDGSQVMIDAADASPLSVDGAGTALADGDSLDLGADRIFRDGDTYTLVFAGQNGSVDAGDARLSVIVRDGFVDVGVQISEDMAGEVEGLLGDGNGNPDDDIALADGTVLARPLAFEDLYGDDAGRPNLRDDWRVMTEEQSLFTYDAGETLEGFYDPDAPGLIQSFADFDPSDVDGARQTLIDNGLQEGTLAFDNALLDVLTTGDDSFVASSSEATAPTPETAGSAGTLAQGETRITLDVGLADAADTGLGGAVVTFSTGGAPILGQAAGAAGSYTIGLGANTGAGRVDAARSYDAETDASIDVTDALNALRLAVGLEPSFGPADPMDFVAADVNRDTDVTVTDALDILRFAVGLETDNAPRWVFLDEAQDLSGTDRTSVEYESGTETGPIAGGASLELTGVLLGDLSGQPVV